jgi:hypothetical protein
MIRLAERQGILKGDLNTLQLRALQWLIIDEMRAESELEEARAKITVLAGNPQLYEHLWPKEEDENIEWITPQSVEEVEDIVSYLESLGGSEDRLED